MTLVQEIVNYFFVLKDWDNLPKEFYIKNHIIYGRYVKPAKQLLELCDNDVEKAKEVLDKISSWANDNGMEYTIETVIKRYPLMYWGKSA